MLKLGEKGAILQRDKETYAIAPHIPCGLVTPQLLRTLADVAEKYEVQAIKITGATRVALLGLKEKHIDAAWSELQLDIGAAVGLCVRSVRTCPGNTYCRLGKQDAIGMGLALDKKYHSLELPGKFKMAVSGCHLSCSESWVRDIGLIGQKDGWQLVIAAMLSSPLRPSKIILIFSSGFNLRRILRLISLTTDSGSFLVLGPIEVSFRLFVYNLKPSLIYILNLSTFL